MLTSKPIVLAIWPGAEKSTLTSLDGRDCTDRLIVLIKLNHIIYIGHRKDRLDSSDLRLKRGKISVITGK